MARRILVPITRGGVAYLSASAWIIVTLLALGAPGLTGCAEAGCPIGSRPEAGRCVSRATSMGDAGLGGTPDATGPEMPSCIPEGEDEPDDAYVDANCDGIDGDAARSIFVSVAGDDEAAGTMEAPVRTLGRALELASSADHRAILVGTGDYPESVVLREGISIYGGYEPQRGWMRTRDALALIRGPSPAVRGVDIHAATTLSHLRVAADDAADGESSVGVSLVRTTDVTLDRMEISAGRGGAGANAAPNGAVPDRGGAGSVGGAGIATELTAAWPGPRVGSGGAGCGCGPGGTGGRAGGVARNWTSGTTATAGGTSPGCPGGVGGGPGPWVAGFLPVYAGRSGERGEDGLRGQSGEGGASMGALTDDGYIPAAGAAGEAGEAGTSGGGGGGGAGCCADRDCTSGGAGGGGGGGGCGGAAGDGGHGGGASIALALVASFPILRHVHLDTAGGGNGGNGAVGGMASLGGLGAAGGAPGPAHPTSSECFLIGAGGPGGDGGDGGMGGAGGGGGGGPSAGIAMADGAELNTASAEVSYEVGTGGRGGGTGAHAGEDGSMSEVLRF